MGLTEFFGMPGLDEETNKKLTQDQMLALASSLLQGSGPSTDPRTANLGHVLGGGLAGMLNARTGSLQNIAGAQKMKSDKDLALMRAKLAKDTEEELKLTAPMAYGTQAPHGPQQFNPVFRPLFQR